MKLISIIGNIGKKELTYTPQGKLICKLSVAVNSKVKGEKTTEWFSVAAWEKVGEVINQYAEVGHKIYIQGNLSITAYTSKDGAPRYDAEITVDKFEFLERAPKDNENPF